MSTRDRFEDAHHRIAEEVKAALGVGTVVATVISIHGEPAGQMVLCDATMHDKATVAERLRVSADCLAPKAAPSTLTLTPDFDAREIIARALAPGVIGEVRGEPQIVAIEIIEALNRAGMGIGWINPRKKFSDHKTLT